ncbi:MAG: flavin-containing monooxygenase, partial [Nannocystaceae bacterium]
YKYEAGYSPDFAGLNDFGGRVVHPQKWTKDIEYTDKRVVVIGSGATAMTLVPALAKKAAHVTMLQRSPTYVISLPGEDPVAKWLRRLLPKRPAYLLTRWKNIAVASVSYQLARHFPGVAKAGLVSRVRQDIGQNIDVDTHFNPHYNPWDQRLCVVPDGDLFKALRRGDVSVVTDHIDRFTTTGIRLRSGDELAADLVVTATGLQMQFAGGMKLVVDGKPVDLPNTLVYKGMMASDVPNCAVAMGYTNASWTLKVDLVCEYVCRLLNHMDAQGYAQCCPRRVDPSITPEHLLDLSASYVERSRKSFPSGGSKRPWKVYQNYFLDRLLLRTAALEDGTMEFRRTAAKPRATRVNPEVA